MSNRFSLEAILSLTDQLTTPYKKSTQKITALNKGLTGSFGALNSGINKTIGFAGKGLMTASKIGIGAMVAGVGLATRDLIALDESITQAGAKFKDLTIGTDDYTKTLTQLSDAARQVGADTEFSAIDAAGALDKMAMAGMNSSQSMALLRGTTDLATAAGTDLTTAVDIATDSLGAFNLVTDDTIQLQKNLSRVSDVMAKTTTTSNTSLTEMFEAVKSGASAFTAAGQEIEDFSALVGVMANSGIKGSEAGTSLRNMMLRLSKPTGEAASVIEQLGVQTQDSQGNFRNIIDILADFEKGLDGMGSAQRTAALSTVFGARAVTGVNVLLAEGTKKLGEYRDNLIDSAGASKTMAGAIRNSIGNQIKVLKSGLTELGLKFVDAFKDKGQAVLKKLITMVQDFDMNIMINAVNKTIDTIKSLSKFIWENRGIIKGLIITLGLFKVAVIAVNAAMIIQQGMFAVSGIIAFVKVMASLAKTEGILATAQYALNIAMTANPIGLVIVAVGALIAIFIALIKYTGSVQGALVMMGKGIMTSLLMPVNLVMEAVKGLLTVLSKIPGVGKFITPAIDALNTLQDTMNQVTLYNEGKNALVGAMGGNTEQTTTGTTSSEGMPQTSIQAIAREKSNQTIENKQRVDVNLIGPSGYAMSVYGNAPTTAINLGAQ